MGVEERLQTLMRRIVSARLRSRELRLKNYENGHPEVDACRPLSGAGGE
jgi:hypothetical protein